LVGEGRRREERGGRSEKGASERCTREKGKGEAGSS